MHQFLCIGNGCTEGGAYRLMTKANAKYRNIMDRFYNINDAACVLRSSRAGGKNNTVRLQAFYFAHRHFIVTNDLDIRLDLSNELKEVIGKAVVVINQ